MKGLIKLTDDLLDLHQLELGNVRFEPQPLDIGAAVAAAVEEMSVLAREVGVLLAAQDLERLPRVMGDPPSVRFVLANLLSNAIRYNRRGGRADVTGSVEGAAVRIAVRDTGVGIPPDEVGKVFDVFFRGSYAREKRRLDTGLGLSLVKGLVEAQGGTVSVESAPGRGSEFAFTLPTAPDRGPSRSAQGGSAPV
jgi:signal transduction histidine kinase